MGADSGIAPNYNHSKPTLKTSSGNPADQINRTLAVYGGQLGLLEHVFIITSRHRYISLLSKCLTSPCLIIPGMPGQNLPYLRN